MSDRQMDPSTVAYILGEQSPAQLAWDHLQRLVTEMEDHAPRFKVKDGGPTSPFLIGGSEPILEVLQRIPSSDTLYYMRRPWYHHRTPTAKGVMLTVFHEGQALIFKFRKFSTQELNRMNGAPAEGVLYIANGTYIQ